MIFLFYGGVGIGYHLALWAHTGTSPVDLYGPPLREWVESE